MTTSNAFESLLAPVGSREFLATYWERRSLYLEGGGRRLPFSFGRNDFFAALEDCLMVKAAFRNEKGQHRESPISADQAPKLFDAGLSICAAQLENGNAPIRAFLDALEDAVMQAGVFHMNGYLSPADKGFGVHFDNHSVWILQVEGRKQWLFSEEPEVPYPVTNLIYPLRRPAFRLPWYQVPRPDTKTFTEVVLEPGDVLYLPAGAWHETRASEYSLSLTLAQEPVYGAQFITDILKANSLRKVAGRRFLPGRLAERSTSEDFEEALKEVFEDCLATLRKTLDGMTAEKLYQVWKAQVAGKQKARQKARASSAASANTSPQAAVLNGKP